MQFNRRGKFNFQHPTELRVENSECLGNSIQSNKSSYRFQLHLDKLYLSCSKVFLVPPVATIYIINQL